MQKPALLYLVHRIPYPPNKGDKIRSFNILKQLSKEFDIHLACFIDDGQDIRYQKDLKAYCKSVCCIEQTPWLSKLKGLKGFVTRQAITLPYYASSAMQAWINQTVAQHNITKVLVFSAAMAQFVEPIRKQFVHAVIDFVDVDSDKWQQYASQKSGLKAWFYKREARLLAKYECEMAQSFDAASFVSEQEAALFISMLPPPHSKPVLGIRNGVDTEFFDPHAKLTRPNNEPVASIKKRSIVFTGAMDYWANVNAVLWFVEHVWPKVLQDLPDCQFFVVGSNPSAQMLALDGKHNIVITGRVEDVRPYILDTCLSVAPLQIARGIQNKVLEALAMAKPVVLTTMAAEGISNQGHAAYVVTDDARDMAKRIIAFVRSDTRENPLNRTFVSQNFSWHSEMHKFAQLLRATQKAVGEQG